MPIDLRDEALKLLDGRGAVLDAAREISAALREAGVEGAIVGGVAVVLHGHVRTTVDVDVYSPEPAERLIEILESLAFVRGGIVVHIVGPEQVTTPPGRLTEIDGVTTVSLADLIAMKLRSGLAKMTRAQDLADVIGLIRKRGLEGGFSSQLPADLRPDFRKLVRAIRDEGPRHRGMPMAGLSPFTLDWMERAVEKVKERLKRATDALGHAGIPYAVAGGHADAAWVGQVDQAATRTTRDVDILVRRADLESIKIALESAGFVSRHSSGLDLFLDGPDAKARDAVHLIFEGEKVRPDEPLSNPAVTDSEDAASIHVLSLPALVQVKLTAFLDKDRVHLRDLIDVGLVDESWCARYPPVLAQRLRGILETPEG